MDADLILSTTDRGKQCLIFDGYTYIWKWRNDTSTVFKVHGI